jgi:Peptidase family M23
MKNIYASAVLFAAACGAIDTTPPQEAISASDEVSDSANALAVSCNPQMSLFPVAAEHNIGYDRSCASGTCPISCPDTRANSDWNGGAGHHGIDVFAFRGAPLVAVADGTIVAVGRPSRTSGLRVRLRDDCGWEYYYGHLDSASVSVGQRVARGTVLGAMGNTGTSGVHLHFNVSPNGNYNNDINPFDLLVSTSPTACAPPPPPPPPPSGCGVLGEGQTLATNSALTSCDGRFSLVAQSDGNLVLYQNGVGPLWWTGTNGNGPVSLAVQGDGNLVLYSQGGTPLWYTWTFGGSAALAMQDDGNLVLYHGQTAVWSSQTCCR